MANINISQIRMKRGNTAAASTYIGPLGELLVDTGLRTIRIQDGATPGGWIVTANGSSEGGGGGNVDSTVTNAINANVTAANLQITALWANAATQATSITTLTANAGSQATSITTLTANAATQAGYITTLQGQVYSNTNAAAYLVANPQSGTYSNVNVQAYLGANVGAYHIWANAAIASLTSNAAIQSALLDTLTGNAATQSMVLDTLTSNAAVQATTLTNLLGNAISQQTSLGDLVANAAAQAVLIASASGTYSNANVASYLPTYSGNLAVDNITNTDKNWAFDPTGNLTLPKVWSSPPTSPPSTVNGIQFYDGLQTTAWTGIAPIATRLSSLDGDLYIEVENTSGNVGIPGNVNIGGSILSLKNDSGFTLSNATIVQSAMSTLDAALTEWTYRLGYDIDPEGAPNRRTLYNTPIGDDVHFSDIDLGDGSIAEQWLDWLTEAWTVQVSNTPPLWIQPAISSDLRSQLRTLFLAVNTAYNALVEAEKSVDLFAGNATYTFGSDGNLTLPGHQSPLVPGGYIFNVKGIVGLTASSNATISGFNTVRAQNFTFGNGVNILSTVAGGAADTGDIIFEGYNISSTANVVNITASSYAQLESGNVYIWAEGSEGDTGGAYIQVGNRTFEFTNISNSPKLKLPAGGDIVNSDGESVLGGANLGNITISDSDITSERTGNFVNLGVDGDNWMRLGTYGEDKLQLIADFSGNNRIWEFGANGTMVFPGGNATISNTDEFRVWSTNGVSMYNNGTDGFGAFDGYVAVYADNTQIGEFTSSGFEVTHGNLVIPTDKGIYYADGSAYGGTASVTTDNETPSTPSQGDLWYNTGDGRMYIRWADTWIDANPTVIPSNEHYTGRFEFTNSYSEDFMTVFDNDMTIQTIRGENSTVDCDINIEAADDVWIRAEGDEIGLQANNTVTISTNTGDIARQWTFGTTGNLSLPYNGYILNDDGTIYGGGGGGNVDLSNIQGNVVVNHEGSGFVVDAGGDRRVGFMKYFGFEGSFVHADGPTKSIPFRIGRVSTDDITLGNVDVFTTEVYVGTNGRIRLGDDNSNTIEDPVFQLEIAGNLMVTDLTSNKVTAVLASGTDSNFQIAARNGVSTNNTGDEVGRFGLQYNGVGWNSFTQYIRGSSSQDGHQVLWAGNTAMLQVNSDSIEVAGEIRGLSTNVTLTADTVDWVFNNDGNITLPYLGTIGEVPNPNGFPNHSIQIQPSGYINSNQKLLVYPTGGYDYNHLHLTSGDLYDTELFLGNDNLYVKLSSTGNVEIRADDNGGTAASWAFTPAGATIFPDHGPVTITGNLTVGNLTVTGNSTIINTTSYTVSDNIVQFADGNPADTLDLGFIAHRTVDSTLQHTGLIRDASEGKWKLFSNVLVQPGNTVDFTDAIYDSLRVGGFESASVILTGPINFTVSPSAYSTPGIQWNSGWQGDIYGNTQVASYLSAQNITSANIGAFQTYANATFSTGAGSTYSNANVVANLQNFATSISTTANITTTANIIAPNYLFANGVNILSTVSGGGGGTYANADVATYLAANTALYFGNPVTRPLLQANATQVFVGNATTIAQGGASALGSTFVMNNAYYNTAGVLTGRNTSASGAGQFEIAGGTFNWNATSSATAGSAAGMGVRMTLSSSALATQNSVGITSAGTLTVNGAGGLVTGQAVGALFNTTATTINLGGAATTIAMGASTVAVSVGSGTGSITTGNVNTTNIYTSNAVIAGGYISGTANIAITSAGNISGVGNIIGTTSNTTITAGSYTTSFLSNGSMLTANIVTTGTYGNITGANVISANSVTVTTFVRTQPVVFAALPTASAAGAGARAFITDANTFSFASTVTGGGGYYVPVFSNGANWFVG